ncbi:1956_t:CDS:2 [Dentiscutata heterogama]|uniref:1956_t:CDS:1 n=1 Tax=Dentiscutata heterogama TaxID=1316150 RepID=A0ACA9PT78_9GLOM|nr:1956_t:CDS:2 [Dentiscutata heterogama]
MPPSSKRKRKARNQNRNGEEGKLDISNRKESKDDGWNKYDELNISDLEWGDEKNSGWDNAKNIETEFKELNLIWKNNSQLEKIK